MEVIEWELGDGDIAIGEGGCEGIILCLSIYLIKHVGLQCHLLLAVALLNYMTIREHFPWDFPQTGIFHPVFRVKEPQKTDVRS
jgi:hypothetical protein